MRQFRIGLLGASKIAPKAIVAPAASVPTAVLSGVAARERKRAEEFAARYGVEKVYDDYAGLAAGEGLDLIYNGLPISAHAEWTIAALNAGKSVLCEKPLAMNAGEARAMLAAAKGGARLIEAFHCRYHPSFEALLGELRAGSIGAVKNITAHFNVAIRDNGTEIRHRPEHGGGAMMDLGCYPLHWVLSILEAAPQEIEARAKLTVSGVDERLHAFLRFPNGVEARVTTSMAEGEAFSAALEIEGEEGRALFDNPVHPHRGSSLKIMRKGAERMIEISRISTYAYQLNAVLTALETGARLPTEGEAVLLQQETLDRIYEAAGLGHLRHEARG